MKAALQKSVRKYLLASVISLKLFDNLLHFCKNLRLNDFMNLFLQKKKIAIFFVSNVPVVPVVILTRLCSFKLMVKSNSIFYMCSKLTIPS